MDDVKLSAEWCEARARHFETMADLEKERLPSREERDRTLAAALRIASRVLDEGAEERLARLLFETECIIHGDPVNWGRSTPEQPRGFKTEVTVHTACARAVLAHIRGAG